MQWTLEFLKLPRVGQHHHGQLLDDEVFAKALVILVRMLAQASEAPARRKAADE
jgi:hypothetical protein